VIQGRGGLGFALKAGEGLRIVSDIFRKEFKGYETVEARVFRFVDDAHASAAEIFDDAVMRDGLANHG
jgi:hypothetical protein